MSTCNKKIKHSFRDMGIVSVSICNKPVYKEEMCLHHYKRKQYKSIPWGERKEYEEATMNDLLSGRSLKLKNSNKHVLYRCKKGVIEQFTNSTLNKWIITDLPVDNNLFCVKKR